LFAYHKNDSFNLIIILMKKLFVVAILCSLSLLCRAQQQLLSYEDLNFLVTNNLRRVDNFMQSKGYTPVKSKKAGNLKYHLPLADNSTSDIEIRANGKRLYIYIATDEVQQLNLLNNSIAPYLISQTDNSGVLTYKVKDLGDIYIMVNDKVPYSPIKRDYDIRIVSDKNITAYN
jgi:myo-inositol-hexaphosphate 3-phosphohydrolase